MNGSILRRSVAMAGLLALAACGTSSENSISNAGVISADESERQYMSNGFSGERSSNPKDGSESGTTGQADVSGAAPGPGANGDATERTTR